MGASKMAGKTERQYMACGSAAAISTGATTVIIAPAATSTRADTRFTHTPATTFASTPEMTIGMKRTDVWITDTPCTSWKLYHVSAGNQ